MTSSADKGAGEGRRIVLTGTFDVRNYGDLLFPLIAAHNLSPWGGTVRAVSPTARQPGWDDAAPVEAFGDVLLGTDPIDGVMIGGGNIIHADPVTLPDYVEAGVAQRAYAELWVGATLAAAARGVPVAWNAPGVPGPLASATTPLKDAVLTAADYLSIRDDESLGNLAAAGDLDAKVVPDTALQLAEIWPKAGLAPTYLDVLARNGADPEAAFLAVHVKERSLRRNENLAISLEAFCRAQNLTPILIGIGACHGDDAVCARIARQLSIPSVDLSRPAGLREIAACIAHASAYVGASMHGYVTATAYGTPGVIVGRPRLPKMAGLLRHLGRKSDEATDWDEGFGKVRIRLRSGPTEMPAHILEDLHAHWDRVRTALASRSEASRSQRRLLLKHLEFCRSNDAG
ncbi:MAG: polysaccharide pyruvyl transferase family protein [Pseudooceanicola sp.]